MIFTAPRCLFEVHHTLLERRPLVPSFAPAQLSRLRRGTSAFWPWLCWAFVPSCLRRGGCAAALPEGTRRLVGAVLRVRVQEARASVPSDLDYILGLMAETNEGDLERSNAAIRGRLAAAFAHALSINTDLGLPMRVWLFVLSMVLWAGVALLVYLATLRVAPPLIVASFLIFTNGLGGVASVVFGVISAVRAHQILAFYESCARLQQARRDGGDVENAAETPSPLAAPTSPTPMSAAAAAGDGPDHSVEGWAGGTGPPPATLDASAEGARRHCKLLTRSAKFAVLYSALALYLLHALFSQIPQLQ